MGTEMSIYFCRGLAPEPSVGFGSNAGHLHKHPVPVTQLRGGTAKQITLNFSRSLDSPVCQKTNLEASYVSNHCVYGMRNISSLWRQAQFHILYKHTQTPCGNNKCVYDGDLCFLYYFRILSGFEAIVKSISFSLSFSMLWVCFIANILIILTSPTKAAVLLLSIHSIIFKHTSCSYTNMQYLGSLMAKLTLSSALEYPPVLLTFECWIQILIHVNSYTGI